MAEQGPEGRVALVVRRHVADEAYAEFTRWQAKVSEHLRSVPGLLRQELVPPAPPHQLDWLVIQRFETLAAARTWLESPARARLLAEIRRDLIGPEETRLFPDAGGEHDAAVSVVFTYTIDPADAAAFEAWQGRIQDAETAFAGFLRHKIEAPKPGLHDDWVVVVSYATDADLDRWLASPERKAVLAEGQHFIERMQYRRTSYGFGFWFREGEAGRRDNFAILRTNLVVLLVLYPVVALWNLVLAGPVADLGVPPWLALFLGNLFASQILGWWAVPAAARRFRWWLAPTAGRRIRLAGYGVVMALYALSMALYGALLALGVGIR
jgi:hypothetical protein